MKGLLRRTWAGIILLVASTLILQSWISAESNKNGYSIDLPISLRIGHIKTSEFKVKSGRYLIEIVARARGLPIPEQICMMGMYIGPHDPDDCHKERLIQPNWTVWCDGQVVAQGSHNDARASFMGNNEFGLYLGDFNGKKRKMCYLDLNLIKDGSALDVTDPHLRIEKDFERY